MCSRRFPLFALSLFLALMLVPSRSYAWDVQPKGVLYSADLDGSRVGYVVSAYNQFDAACYAMGKDPNTISSAVKQKLSDSNYGGRFYDYAQSFFTQSGGLENVPTWVPAYVILVSELGDLVLSDYQGVWYSTATKSLYDDAMVDFVRVLNGEDVGGGGSGGVPATSFVARPNYNNKRKNWTGFYGSDNLFYTESVTASGSPFVVLPSTFNLLVPDTFFSSLSDSVLSNYDFVFRWDGFLYTDASYGSCRFYIYGLRKGSYTVSKSSFSSNGVSYEYLSNISTSQSYLSCNTNLRYTFDGSDFTVTTAHVPSFSTVSAGSINVTYCTALCFTSDSSVPPPSGVWPEPEPTPDPTAPVLPDPVTPTVQPDPVVTEPTVTWPSPTITIDPAPVPGTTPTGLDYTELLTRINDNLISIDSFSRALNSNLNSLRSDLVNEFDGVVSGLRNIYTYLQHMDSVLERHCIHLQNKMEDVSVDIQNKIREMARWLADELDFDSESSGNSDLFGILSTINDKLGGGTYEPNPLKDENAYYEWLDDLWDRFLLGDNWQSSASSMSQSFGQLTSRFPFSVPWDIVALFRLFVHDPVTPVFDLPLYYSSEDSATVRVDLSAWNGVASVVRPLVFVIFALKLALLSRHLLAGFGADKGGL